MRSVREAIRGQLALFTEEVTAELAKDRAAGGWSDDDLSMLAGLYVDQTLVTASLFLEALGSAEEQQRVARLAARRLRLIGIGRAHWLD
ncbi:hypothetical protein GCM10020295_24160 [Streptomyces cinereospinus]